MKPVLFVIAACFAGSLLSLQASINAQLSRLLDSSIFAAFISFLLGTVALLIVLLIRGELSIGSLPALMSAPPWVYIGGVLGAVYVASVIILLPKLGVTTTMLAVVGGQVLMSLILDHFGAFGMPVREFTMLRVSGAVLVICGLSLVFAPNMR